MSQTPLDYQPQEWGPAAWKFLHTITFAYPESPDHKTQEHTYHFFEMLQHVLPCSKCRGNFRDKFRQISTSTFRSREALTRWLVDIHNVVNASHGKPLLEYDAIKSTYAGEKLLCGSVPANGNVNPPQKEETEKKRPPRKRSPYFGFIVTIVVLIILLVLMCVLVGIQCSKGGGSSMLRWASARTSRVVR